MVASGKPKFTLKMSQKKPNIHKRNKFASHHSQTNGREKERGEKQGEFGKYVGVMSILMYDSINQQSAVNKGGRERKGGRGPWRICSGLRTEVKLSGRTMGFCVPLCYLYCSIFSYFSFLCLYIQSVSPKKILFVLCSFVVFFSKVDNRCLGRKPLILISCSLQLLSTFSLHFEFTSTSFPSPLPPPLHILISHYSFLPLIFLSFFPLSLPPLVY